MLKSAGATGALYAAQALGVVSTPSVAPSGTMATTVYCGTEVFQLPGDLLKAFDVAFSDFKNLSEIPNAKKNLDNYDVHVAKTPHFYEVVFEPHKAPGEQPHLGADVTSLGAFRIYEIDLRTFRILMESQGPI
jgi:hypothetical protein